MKETNTFVSIEIEDSQSKLNLVIIDMTIHFKDRRLGWKVGSHPIIIIKKKKILK